MEDKAVVTTIARRMKDANIWFPAKRHGWGWGLPCRWQGWVVLAAWIALLAAAAAWFGERPEAFVAAAIALSLVLVAICWMKGEKPRWRWGKD